mgnify:CR=1 FL=1
MQIDPEHLEGFWNKLFKESYPELEFIDPGSTVENLFAL